MQIGDNVTAVEGTATPGTGLTISRFTTAGEDPFSSVQWSKRTSRITNPDGSVVFEMADAEVPEAWSQVAADIMVSKYFPGVPSGRPPARRRRHPCATRPATPSSGRALRQAGDWSPRRLLAPLGR